jgi:hypothetical protein
LSRAIEFVTPAVNPKANSALWVVMMCTLVQDADGGCVWGEGGSGDRLCRKSLYFMLFTVKLNLLEIIKSLKKKKTNGCLFFQHVAEKQYLPESVQGKGKVVIATFSTHQHIN